MNFQIFFLFFFFRKFSSIFLHFYILSRILSLSISNDFLMIFTYFLEFSAGFLNLSRFDNILTHHFFSEILHNFPRFLHLFSVILPEFNGYTELRMISRKVSRTFYSIFLNSYNFYLFFIEIDFLSNSKNFPYFSSTWLHFSHLLHMFFFSIFRHVCRFSLDFSWSLVSFWSISIQSLVIYQVFYLFFHWFSLNLVEFHEPYETYNTWVLFNFTCS